jgi:hypothetical protein
MSFLILSLPRSRSAWLAHYLSYPLARPPQYVGHDILAECSDVQTFLNSYSHGMWGSCETGGAMLWEIVRQEMPECRIVLVRRPMIEVYRSLAAKGVIVDLSMLAELDQHLNQASLDPSIVSVPYAALSDRGIGKWIFEYCLELDWDELWWQQMVATNIQVDMPEWIKRLNGKRESFLALISDVNRRSQATAPRVLH